MQIFNYLLAPFTLLYKLVTGLRNHLYNVGNKHSHSFDCLTIGVGNLRVGGTGKTPMSEYLIRNFLSQDKSVAYLSRGYGRKTKGFVQVNLDSTSTEVGDESLQIKHHFPEVNVAVCEERIVGIPKILYEFPSTDAIVLDDVFQHRSVKPSVQILLSSYNDLFYNDYVLPMGRLRERRKGAKRADVVIVTKCPALSVSEIEAVTLQVSKYTDAPVLFSSIQYSSPLWVSGESTVIQKVVVVSAIVQNKAFEIYCKDNFEMLESFQYQDHHEFSVSEVKEIVKFVNDSSGSTIVTTDKDWQRLKKHKELLCNTPVYVIPIEVQLQNEEILWESIAKANKILNE